MITVRMVQTMPYSWRIESSTGAVIQKGIVATSLYEAEDYVRRYVQSFGWAYQMVLLTTHKETKD